MRTSKADMRMVAESLLQDFSGRIRSSSAPINVRDGCVVHHYGLFGKGEPEQPDKLTIVVEGGQAFTAIIDPGTRRSVIRGGNLNEFQQTMGPRQIEDTNWKATYFDPFAAAFTKHGFTDDLGRDYGVYGLPMVHNGKNAVVAWCYPDNGPADLANSHITVRGLVERGGTKQDSFYFGDAQSFAVALRKSMDYANVCMVEARQALDREAISAPAMVSRRADGFLNEDIHATRPVDVEPLQASARASGIVPMDAGSTLGAVIYIAHLDSRHFSFTALGGTEEEARQAIKAGLDAHTAKLGLQADWWSPDDINVDECPLGGCLRDHNLLTGPSVMTDVTAIQQRPLDAAANRIRADVVFADAPEPEGMHWRNMSNLENELAAKLLPLRGAIVAIDRDAWVLRESGDNLVLCHATLTSSGLSDERSRFDFGLEWVDEGTDEIREYNDLLARVIDEFDKRVALEAQVVTRLTVPEVPVDREGPKGCVTHGVYSGSIVSVEGGVVTQRINRAGETVRHDSSKISAVPPVGSVVDVRYRDGRGHVTGPDLGKGLDR